MVAFLENEFGYKIESIKKLNGYSNINYLINTSASNYIFKTYVYSDEIYEFTVAENDILLNLQNSESDKYPKPQPFLDGSYVKITEFNGEKVLCRMLSFLEGDFTADASPSEALYSSFGTFMGHLNLELNSISNSVIKGKQTVWDLQYFNNNRKFIKQISNISQRHKILYFFQQYEENVRPYIYQFRKQIIHGDANEFNVLANKNAVTGIIDFGDMAHSQLINEVAISLTYIGYDKEQPLKWMQHFLKGYQQILQLTEKEIQVLYYLIAARLCTSVCNSANAKKENPENTYATVSEVNAWKTIDKWLAIGPIQAENAFREAIGLEVIQSATVNQLLNQRHTYLSEILSTSYKNPIHMKRSAFQYMYDAYGNSFLDAYNNIPHVGHSHPKVVAAGQRQMSKLNTNTRYLYEELHSYAEKLLSKFPGNLNKVFFVNSGSAASDLAIRLAKFHTDLERIMVIEEGYHGNTQTSIDISDYKFNNPKGQGKKDYILKTPLPNTYNGKYSKDDYSNPGELYAKDTIAQIQNSEKPIAAFIAEPIVGCAGQVVLAKDYLKHIYPVIRKQGGVCISDEVQTGFGRVGKAFWGFQLHDVIPDIVVLGKPIANGHPMGAVVCTEAIAKSFEKGVEFFSSFGGNPVSCEIASAVLDVIEEENLQENAEVVGNYYLKRLHQLKLKHASIGDVRGSGLFIGIEIVKPNTKLPDTALAHEIKNTLRDKNILISTDGKHDNVIKSKPPLCFTKANVDTVVDAIVECL